MINWIPRPGQWVLFTTGNNFESVLPLVPAIHRVKDDDTEWTVGIWDAGGIDAYGNVKLPRIMVTNTLGDNVQTLRKTVAGGFELCNMSFALDEVKEAKPLLNRNHLPPLYVCAPGWIPRP